MSGRPSLDAAGAAEALAGGAFLLDVRQPEEFAAAHVDGAVLIPLGELADRIADVPGDGRVVVVCRSGNRSGVAVDALRAAGFDAWNLDGGMVAWAAAGLPTAER